MRIIIALLLAAIASLVLAGPARAVTVDQTEWFLIDDDVEADMYARISDLRNGRPESRAARLWILIVLKDGSQIKTLYAVDCVAETYRDIQSIAHKPNGDVAAEWAGNKTKFINPDTNMSATTSILCAPPTEQNTTRSSGYVS